MGTSLHRVGRKKVEVERRWHDTHLEAGYADQEWGEHSHPTHRLHGRHEGAAGTLRVEHVDEDPAVGGPSFRIHLPDGSSVTVLCADTVRAYLDLHGVPG